MFIKRKTWLKLLDNWPGYQKIGPFSFLPVFFLCGAGVEYFMINFKVGEVSFYNTYKKRQIEEIVQKTLWLEKLLEEDNPKDSN